VTLIKALHTVPVISLLALAALADDAAPPPRGAAMAACKQDVQTLCADVQRGGGRIMECLKSHADKVSPDCKAAMQAAHDRRQHPPATAAPSS
jgi:Cysteine rich repeat